MRTTTAALAAFFVLTVAFGPVIPPPALADPSAWRADELPYLALQAQTTSVTIPWGEWLSTFLAPLQQVIATLLLAAATAVVAMLPSWVQDIVRPMGMTWRTNQLFEKAAAAAIAGVRGVTTDKVMTIDTTNNLVRTGLQIVVERGAPVVLDFAGRSARSLAEKLLARLHEQGAAIPADYTLTDAAQQANTVLAANPAKPA